MAKQKSASLKKIKKPAFYCAETMKMRCRSLIEMTLKPLRPTFYPIKYQGKKVGRKGFGVNSQSNHLRLVLFANSGTDVPQSVNCFALGA